MKYKLVSSDTHLEVSIDQWHHRLPGKYRDEGPRVVKLEDGGDGWMIKGAKQPVLLGLNLSAGKAPTEWQVSGFSYKQGQVGTGDAKQRLREMDQDGVMAELDYPALGLPDFLAHAAEVHRDLYMASIEAYNDFISDFCMYAPDRLLGIAILPVTGIDDALAELRRTRKLPGIKGWQITRYPAGRKYPTPDDDNFWAQAIGLRVPITVHGNLGSEAEDADMIRKRNGNAMPLQAHLSISSGPVAYNVSQLIVKGVFDRFPDLKLHFAESGVGWAPYFLQQADYRFQRHKFVEKHFFPDFEEPKLVPSEYFHRHVLLGFRVDYHGVAASHEIGVKNMCWGSGFPHAEGDWPFSQRIVATQFRNIPKEGADPILWRNVAEFYHMNVA